MEELQGSQMVLPGNEREGDRNQNMMKTSDELPEFSGWEETFGDWRGLED